MTQSPGRLDIRTRHGRGRPCDRRELFGGEDGTVLADVDRADVAAAALAHAALHLHLQGGDDLLVGKAQLGELGQGELDHDGRPADHSNRISKIYFYALEKLSRNSDRTIPLFISLVDGPVSFKLLCIIKPVEQRFINAISRSF